MKPSLRTLLGGCLALALSVGSFSAVLSVAAASQVPTALVYLQGAGLTDSAFLDRLAAYDALVLASEVQVYYPSAFAQLRRRNPEIKLLAYVPTVSWNEAFWTDPLHVAMKQGIQDHWWLRDAAGNGKAVWPGTRALNLNSGWVDYLADHVAYTLMPSGNWDGVFYDEMHDSIQSLGPVDIDNNGQDDDAGTTNARWVQGYERLFQITRAKIGADRILINNGSSLPGYFPYVNGRMFESFPAAGSSPSQWSGMLRDYLSFDTRVGYNPPFIILNVNTGNAGDGSEYRRMRFGLATALLGDGYYSFTFGDQDHGQLWRYDEYGAALGSPKGDPIALGNNLWTREYSNGKVVVNGAGTPQTVTLEGEYEKLHGIQDPSVNNGGIVSRVSLASQDGLILLRPIESLRNAAFPNGAFARIFNGKGEVKRTGFFAYDDSARGGSRVLVADLDHDGIDEKIVAGATFVTVTSGNRTIAHFAPYGIAYKLGMSLAVGNVDGDAKLEIVTGAGRGGGPHVRMFQMDGTALGSFFAYDKKFTGGISVAVGDVDGDGKDDIVTGPGRGGGPQVRIFTPAGKPIGVGFFAYAKNFTGGVNVAVGDIDKDGRAEIVTGPGRGGGPHVRAFNERGIVKAQFFAGNTTSRDGTDIAVADLDGDGHAEIIGLSTNVFTLASE